MYSSTFHSAAGEQLVIMIFFLSILPIDLKMLILFCVSDQTWLLFN